MPVTWRQTRRVWSSEPKTTWPPGSTATAQTWFEWPLKMLVVWPVARFPNPQGAVNGLPDATCAEGKQSADLLVARGPG